MSADVDSLPMRDTAWRGPVLIWFGLLAICLALVLVAPSYPWLMRFPAGWQLPIADWVRDGTDPFFQAMRPYGRAFAMFMEIPLSTLRAALLSVPWPALILVMVTLSAAASGIGLALFAALSLGAVVLVGYWPQAMSTLALVLLTVPLAVFAGFLVGALVQRWPLLWRPVVVVLDVMQTFPAFAYLIPLLLLFGLGPIAGLVASVIFALPPMVRNTVLGLRGVMGEIYEAALSSVASQLQMFRLECETGRR